MKKFSILIACLMATGTVASAGVWDSPVLPASEVHPGLYFTSADIPELKNRIKVQPYKRIWKDYIKLLADESLTWDFTVPEAQFLSAHPGCRRKCYYVVCHAFAYLMTGNPAYLDQARDGLVTMFDDNNEGYWGTPPGTMGYAWTHYGCQPVMNYARTYDMIRPYLSSSDESTARQKLAAKADILAGLICVHGWTAVSNHVTRSASGAGLVALALSDHPDASYWLDCAFTGMKSFADQCLLRDGVYGEGPHYSQYTASAFIPFMVAYKNRTGVDLFSESGMEAWIKWQLNIRMPNGLGPAGPEDSWNRNWFPYLLAANAYPDDVGMFKWAYDTQHPAFTRDPDATMFGAFDDEETWFTDIISTYDDSDVTARPPSEDSAASWFNTSGHAVFRSDWSSAAVYGLLANSGGFGHGQVDTSSIIVHAYGKDLIIDSGYGPSFYARDQYIGGDNHNIMKVNGSFPADTAALGNYFGTNRTGYAEAPNNLYRRRMLFPDKRYFVIADHVSGGAKSLEFYLHGLHSFSKPASNVVKWTNGTAEVLCNFISPSVSISSYQDNYSQCYEHEAPHTVAKINGTGDQMLTVIYPKQTADSDPDIRALSIADAKGCKITSGTFGDIVISKLNANVVSAEGVATDGEICLTHLENGDLEYFFNIEGTTYEYAGNTYYESPETLDVVSLEIGTDLWEGYVKGDGDYSLTLHTGEHPHQIYYRGESISFSFSDGVSTVVLAGEGEISVVYSPPEDGGSPADEDASPGDDGGSTEEEGADQAQPPDEPGCGCSGSGGSDPWLWLLPGILLWLPLRRKNKRVDEP